MKRIFFSTLLFSLSLNAQVTGLSNWSLFLDPGHSQKENMGVNGYSEAESNLKTALHVKDLFTSKTDIGSIWTSRTNNTQLVGLGDRSVMANNLGADWFHSMHSNAPSSTNSTVLLLYGESRPNVEKVPNGGKALSYIMTDVMSAAMRIPEAGGQGARGDCVFYGASTGPYLSVNRNTQMPSELSESGHHTVPWQNNRQMNNEHARLVAYSVFWSVLDLHGIERPYPGILTGIVSDSESKVPINGATIQVNGNTYTTDTFESLFNKYTTDPNKLNNGFYFFEDLPDQAHEVVITAEGYYPDTLQIAGMADKFATFLDVKLTANTPPYITASLPENGDTLVPSWNSIKLRFNRPMNTTSVESALSLSPSHTGSFEWSADEKTATFTPDDTLGFLTEYTLTIAGTAVDQYNHPIDGDGDGVGGDPWIIQFTTGLQDMDPPVVIGSYPTNNLRDVSQTPVITVVYNERILPASFSSDLAVVTRYSSGQAMNTYAELSHVGLNSLISIYVLEELNANEFHQVRILPGLEDNFGHATQYVKYINFTTTDIAYNIQMIDDFDGEFNTYWWSPKSGVSGQTTGVINDSTNYWKNTSLVTRNSGSTQSMQLDYGWDTTSVADGFIRLYLSGGAPQAVRFDKSYMLQTFVYGDGQGNQMRFAVDDNNGTEVSPWYTVDWLGWRLVSWDMQADGTGTWIGDGVLNGSLRVDSFQFQHPDGAGIFGTYYIDDLRIARDATVSTDQAENVIPSEFALLPNYPNPFNPWTNIPFSLPERSAVTVEIYNLRGERVDQVMSGNLEAGVHVTRWNGSSVSSGVYLVKLQSGNQLVTQKITVLK